jgi:endo-1,4-beta-xylanase
MKKKILLLINCFCIFTVCFAGCKNGNNAVEIGLKDALKDKFLIGVAMNSDQITGKDSIADKLISKHFSSIVAENCMKSGSVQAVEGKFDFSLADQFVNFGLKNKMAIIGHTLIWHSQAPRWFFVDNEGKTVSREVLIQRMKTHITTVMTRYKGKIKGWDVVNEAVNDDGTLRESPFMKIIGKDYLKLAYQFAHEADPNAELYYNDYSMAIPSKREGVVRMVKELQQQGIKIAAIGMQGHCTMSFPTIEEEEKSIEAFAGLGVKVMITELDITVLPNPGHESESGADVGKNFKYDSKLNPYKNGLPDSVATALHNRYADLFRLFLKRSDQISRVTVWGLTDEQSWRNNWPVRGRTDYSLLFDRNYHPKEIVKTIINEACALKK